MKPKKQIFIFNGLGNTPIIKAIFNHTMSQVEWSVLSDSIRCSPEFIRDMWSITKEIIKNEA